MNESIPCRKSRDATLVSVVLPVFNEADVLDALTQSVKQALTGSGLCYEIVFVNDGSRDDSPRVLDELAAADPHVRVVHFSRNFGHQAAVQAGLAHARGDAVVLMDSDMQDSPAAIGQFVEKWREGFDVVYAIRTDRKEGRLKRCCFAAFHRLLASISTTPIPVDAGNFGLLDRRVVDELVRLGDRDRYLPGLRSWVGFRQTGIEVERLARYDDQPRVSFWGLWRLAKTAIFGFSTFPLTMFYLIGCVALGIFAAVSAFSLACRLFTDLAIPGWTSHVLIGCFFGALNALGISILGEYVVRIYDQVRGRPLYLVDRRVNLDLPAPGPDTSRGDEPYTELLTQLAELVATSRETMLADLGRAPAASSQPAERTAG
jgi:dolichol-phosphate mannosyltransferase